MIKLIVISSLFLLLSACSEKDHIEECVQSGLRVWEDSQAFDLKIKKEKEEADLKAKSEIKPEIDCEIKKNCTGFFPIPYTSTGAKPVLSEQDKNFKEPDTRNKAEFRIRSHCLSQASSKPSISN